MVRKAGQAMSEMQREEPFDNLLRSGALEKRALCISAPLRDLWASDIFFLSTGHYYDGGPYSV